MKTEHLSATPKEEVSSQLQDPLERRRLQNRLSQRNHRRKIRDRIAKLQERVIANELRAAAALNGWDQQYMPSPVSHSTHPALSGNGFGFDSRDLTPLAIEPSTPFTPSTPIFSSISWPSDFNTLSSHNFNGESPSYGDGSLLAHSNGSSSSTIASLGGEISREMTSPGEILPSDLWSASQGNQPSYYVATEAALPQILQVIYNMSPQSKVIVLVSPESPASASIPSFPPSSSYNGLGRSTMPQQFPQDPSCLCYPQNIHSRSWMDAGSYTQRCPIHKISSTGRFTG
ncbi:uncharacterized protein N7511_000121 [Penicillium nucicola]|uniref:uncharacterized protein n=1 Tax=Penicillium nucicola TaxID=1850975 RepID=UPI0025450E58|nr:uncharacterized protein N7511_000121 [Penicillium nucicola]KAJ5775110.1 hypothetical protein N7511_000121 [Penicillium nucicola]